MTFLLPASQYKLTFLFSLVFLLQLQCATSRSCVAVNDEYQCTDDPLLLTRMKEHQSGSHKSEYNLGLAQRIDGTESEKEAIVDVLARMDAYFIDEVLSQVLFSLDLDFYIPRGFWILTTPACLP
jgi:hypothetical protein